MEQKKPDIVGTLLIASFFILLSYAGYLSYKSIDWNVLKRLESQKLVLPTPIMAKPSTESANPTPAPTVKP